MSVYTEELCKTAANAQKITNSTLLQYRIGIYYTTIYCFICTKILDNIAHICTHILSATPPRTEWWYEYINIQYSADVYSGGGAWTMAQHCRICFGCEEASAAVVQTLLI